MSRRWRAPTSCLSVRVIMLSLALALAPSCASAPPVPPRLGSAALFVTNTLEVPVQVYELYQLRPVFDPRQASALCNLLGEIPARDSLQFTVTAGVGDPIGLVIQADSLNGSPAEVSRAMQSRVGDTLRWTLRREMRTMPVRRSPRQQMGPQLGGGGARTTTRC